MSNKSRLFEITEDHVILVSQRGVYRQVKIARRGTELYAVIPGGFVRLYGNRTTSNPGLRWVEIDGVDTYITGRFGALEAA